MSEHPARKGRRAVGLPRGLLTGVLLLACVITLAKALSEDIITTQFAEVGDLVRSFYPEKDYLADNATAASEDYEHLVEIVEQGSALVLSLSSRAQIIYQDLTEPKNYTVTAGALQLYRAGDFAPALLILLFSVALPILKTALMLFVSVAPLVNRPHQGDYILRILNLSHKYTMLDVFVVAITVFAFSDQVMVSVTPAVALYWYIGYMVVSYAALWLLQERRQKPAAQLERAMIDKAAV